MAPHWRIIPSQTAWGAASEPVCDIVARAPASVWPPFQTTTGLRAQAIFSVSKKRRPSLHAFDVHADDLGLVVERQVLEVVADIEDDGVAEAGAAAEVQPVRVRDETEHDPVRARLGEEADLAVVGDRGIVVEADARLRQVEAHAVRADEVEVGFPRHVGELVLELDAELFARLGEPGGEEARAVRLAR